jgi:hypothetical protein
MEPSKENKLVRETWDQAERTRSYKQIGRRIRIRIIMIDFRDLIEGPRMKIVSQTKECQEEP